MTTLTETAHAGEFLVSEAAGHRSREQVTIASGAALLSCTVLGALIAGTVGAATADGGNTGNGTIGAVTGGASIEAGIYDIVCVKAAANGGEFEVRTPSDKQLPKDAKVGTAYTSKHLNFTVADGAVDFVVDDKFTVAVSGTGEYKALVPSAVDGSNKAVAILYAAADAATAAVQATIIARDAEVRASDLAWPSGITADEKTAAIAELETAGIISR